ncbi:MAG TPA: hypothetical protein VJG65_02345, partial [Patescibacteria group bacterium]|nr:hypothetical protein [Patescibacteria group bacterium]
LIKKSGLTAIELTAHDLSRVEMIETLDFRRLNSFEYISIHAPTFEIKYGFNQKSRIVLKSIAAIYKKIKFNLVIFHPDTISNLEVFSNFDFPVGIENMDNRKNFGQNPSDLKKFFSRKKFKFVLDLQHIHTNDPTMDLTDDFLAVYKKRLAQIHLSGYDPVNLHHPLYLTKQKNIIQKAVGLNVPIIIESSFNPKNNLSNQIRQEFRYVKSFLNHD